MSDETALVIKFGKESYVRDRWSGHYEKDALIINGRRDWPKAKGSEEFRVVNGAVKSIERYAAPLRVTTKWALRPDLICAAKPGWVTPEEYERLSDLDQALYSRVTEEREQKPTPIPFMVVDGKAEPRKMPSGIAPKVPHHINEYPWFWWTLPCSASPDYVFGQLKARVAALDPARFDVVVYTSTKHMRVTTHGIDICGVTFKPSTSLLWLDRDKGHFRGMDADNLDAVIAKVEAWCDEQMKPVVAAQSLKSCPCCRTPLKNVAKLTGRDPRYRIAAKHDIS